MHLNNYVKTTIFGLVCLLSSIALAPTANAFPTVDFGNIAKKIQSGVTQVQQKVKMVTQCKAVTEINNAIGKAKSMAAMAQSKAEELKKQAEKIKKIKEEAEKKLEKVKELKKKYEEQKAKLEAYQQKVKEQAEKAKKAVNDAKNKVNEVKDKVNDVKNQVNDKVNEVKSKVDEAKNKVNEVKDKVNEAKDKVNEAKNKVNAIKDQATSKINAVQNAAGNIQNKVNAATSAVNGKLSAASGGASAVSNSGAGLSAGGSALSAKSAGSESLKSVGLSGTALTPASGTTGRVGFTQAGSSVATSTPLSKADSALSADEEKLINKDLIKEGTPLLSKELSEETEELETEELSVDEKQGAVSSAKTGKNLSKTDMPSSASSVKATAKQTGKTTQLQTKPVQSVAKSTSTRSKAGFTAPTSAPAATSAPASTLAPVATSAPVAASEPAIASEPVSPSEEETVKDEKQLKAEENIEKIEEVANEEGSFAALRTLKQTMTEAIRKGDTKTLGAISEMDTAKIVNSNSKIYEPTAEKTTGRKAFTVSPSKTNEKKIDKDAPAALGNPLLQKRSSLWLDDGEFARQNSIKLSYADTLRFATGASDCDYEYKMVVEANGNPTDVFIMPETLAKECCLKPEQLKNMNVIPDCVSKISEKLTDDDESAKADAQGMVADLIFEQSKQGNAEAIEDQAVAASYTEDVLTKLYETVQNVEDNNSGVSNIAIANVELLYLMNRIRKIYTSSLITAGLGGIDSATKEVLDPETDIGLTNDENAQYDYIVTRTDAETAIDFPIMPQSLAQKCSYTLGSDTSVMRNCYITIFNEQYERDKEATSRAFIDNIQYYEMVNVLTKGLFQKVKSAEYEQGQMKQTKEKAQDTSDAHLGKEAIMETEKGMLTILDDIIRGYASRIAYNGLTTLTKLMPVEKATTAK